LGGEGGQELRYRRFTDYTFADSCVYRDIAATVIYIAALATGYALLLLLPSVG